MVPDRRRRASHGGPDDENPVGVAVFLAKCKPDFVTKLVTKLFT